MLPAKATEAAAPEAAEASTTAARRTGESPIHGYEPRRKAVPLTAFQPQPLLPIYPRTILADLRTLPTASSRRASVGFV